MSNEIDIDLRVVMIFLFLMAMFVILIGGHTTGEHMNEATKYIETEDDVVLKLDED